MTTIGGETRLVALLRSPLRESLSPRMQNAAFAARGLDWAYVAVDVTPEGLAAAVDGLRAMRFAGANVTTPHKQAVVPFCDELDDRAERAGSVNTLILGEGRVVGTTTDGDAVTSVVEPAGAEVLVLGTGGAARAVASAFGHARARVHMASRRGQWPPDSSRASVVVNATPVRDEPIIEPRRGQVIVDLPYRADGKPTALVAAARAAGCEVVDGLEILVRQGAASFERWTGVPAPVEVMRRAVRDG